MAHEIDMSNGIPAMAYLSSDGKPWHTLGNSIDPEFLKGKSAEEIITLWQHAAGMNFSIRRSEIRYNVAGMGEDEELRVWKAGKIAKNGTPMDHSVVLFRSDNGNPLSVVSSRYHIVQPTEVMNFFHDLVELLGYEIATAGVLFDGRQCWCLAKAPGSGVSIRDKNDIVERYLVLSTSCDGTGKTRAYYTSVRVVCANTLAYSDTGQGVTVSHKQMFDPAYVKRELDILGNDQSFASAMEDFRAMAGTRINQTQAVDLTGMLCVPGWENLVVEQKASTIEKSKTAHDIGELLLRGNLIGADMEGAGRDTVYGWLNAVTQYVDHSDNNRSLSAESSFDSAMFGKGGVLKARALLLARKASAGKLVLEEVAELIKPEPIVSATPNLDSILSSMPALV